MTIYIQSTKSDNWIFDLKENYTTYNKNKDNDAESFIQEVEREVMNLPIRKRNQFYKMLIAVSAITIPMLNPQFAHAQTMKTSFQRLSKETPLQILPPEIVDILNQLIVALGKVGILLAILCLMTAGFLTILRQKEKAKSWMTDIIKGLAIVILSPMIILILVYLTSFVLGNVPQLQAFYRW